MTRPSRRAAVLALILGALVTACASREWVRNPGSNVQAEQDQYECQREATALTGFPWGIPFVTLFNQCMRARGYQGSS
jgi:hypothetical protein